MKTFHSPLLLSAVALALLGCSPTASVQENVIPSPTVPTGPTVSLSWQFTDSASLLTLTGGANGSVDLGTVQGPCTAVDPGLLDVAYSVAGAKCANAAGDEFLVLRNPVTTLHVVRRTAQDASLQPVGSVSIPDNATIDAK